MTLALVAASTLSPIAYAQGTDQLAPYYRSTIQAYEANPVDPAARSWEAVDTLNNVGIAYRYLGNPEKAWELHQQALDIARAIGDRRREAATLQNLGTTASQLGDDQGIAFFQSQLALARDRNDLALEADLLEYLSFSYSSIGETQALLELYGDYIPLLRRLARWDTAVYALVSSASLHYSTLSQPQQAFELLDEAVAIATAHNPSLLNIILINQATFYRLAEDWDNAINVYEQALSLSDQSGPYQDRLLLQQHLAHAYEAQDRINDAIVLHQANLALARQQEDAIWIAWSMDDLSFAYRQLQDYDQALNWQLQALEQHRKTSGENTLSLFNGYNNLGWIYLALEDFPAAEQSLRQAIQGYGDMATDLQENQGLFRQSNDDLQVNFREGFADAHQALQAALVAQNKVEQALIVAEQSRARSIVSLLALKTTQTASVPAPNIEAMKTIARSHNTTLVEYSVLYDQPRMTASTRLRQPPQEKTLLIWVIPPTGDINLRQVDLQEQSPGGIRFETPLANLIQDTRQALGVPGRGFDLAWRTDAVSPQSPIAELQHLHQILIDPIADLLPQDPTATVTFIPQDMLFFTPFAALQDQSGRFLIERHTPVTAPSTQFLALTEARQQQLNGQDRPSSALVVGNPTMPQVQLGFDSPQQQLPALPGSEREANDIARLLETRPLIGEAATEAEVLRQLPTARIIHLATHGLLDPVYGFQSALAFAPGADEDGLLKTREIINLDLQADLVVLSACDTGRGRLTGDGVIGLARSFVGAGVPSIVVSLWVIPDAPTAKLMTEFYQQMAQGESKAQALRQAMLTTLETHPDPRNWAAFTLIGEAD
ncbi:MAG: CHAT domain-containing tetratricopeptide repeat protein [Cyanobacteria bacterium J06632_22]